jgi:hypothetical protein
MFGRNSVLNLPFQVAAKTGTTNDFRDNWTLGYTPDLVTGVWVGNADYTPMVNTTGLTGAAPIWSQFMQIAVPYVTNNAPTPFTVPPGIVEKVICVTSGTEPSNTCRGGERSEFFANDQPPLPKSQDLFRKLNIDTWTGLVANDNCKDFVKDDMVMNVSDKFARQWLRSGEGKDWLESHDMPRNPTFSADRECKPEDPHPVLDIQSPKNGDTVTQAALPVVGVIDVKNGGFSGWRLEYGPGADPGDSDWVVLTQGNNPFPQAGLIYTWDLSTVQGNQVTLRLYLMNGEDGYAEKRSTFNISLPTPTASPTLSPTAIPPTAFPTDTSVPVVIPTETLTPSPLPPSETPSPSATTGS